MYNNRITDNDWAKKNQEGTGKPVLKDRYSKRKLSAREIEQQYHDYSADDEWDYDLETNEETT